MDRNKAGMMPNDGGILSGLPTHCTCIPSSLCTQHTLLQDHVLHDGAHDPEEGINRLIETWTKMCSLNIRIVQLEPS